MPRPKSVLRLRGFSLIELIFAMAITLVVIALVVQAVTGLVHEQGTRQKVVALQGGARQAIDLMEMDLRHASLASSTGVIWTGSVSGSERVSRPSVQVFTAVSGSSGAILADAKPNTDAILIVESVPGSAERSATVGALSTSVGAFNVTDASQFSAGDLILLGDYGDASWGRLRSVEPSNSPQQLTIDQDTTNILPGKPVPQLGPGALVRRARSRLYYVNTSDELVRLSLSVPRPPVTASDLIQKEVLANGFENMQIDFQLDNGSGGLVAASDSSQPAPVLTASDTITTEAASALGTFAAGGGPRFTAANIGSLRTVIVNVSVRSPTPLVDAPGDPAIPLAGASGLPVTLAPGGGVAANATFARRAYRLVASVRNTSTGSL